MPRAPAVRFCYPGYGLLGGFVDRVPDGPLLLDRLLLDEMLLLPDPVWLAALLSGRHICFRWSSLLDHQDLIPGPERVSRGRPPVAVEIPDLAGQVERLLGLLAGGPATAPETAPVRNPAGDPTYARKVYVSGA